MTLLRHLIFQAAAKFPSMCNLKFEIWNSERGEDR